MPASNLPEFRHARTGSLNIQPTSARSNGIMSPAPGGQRFDGPRSPPNTSHVPCKFFRQGACQAGNACPFSHDLGTASETVCKYFAKGNCKFGPKCANIHMLPDGRRINYGKNGNLTIGSAAPVALGARVNLTTYHAPSNSALTNSFLRADGVPPYTATSPYDEQYEHQLGRQPSMENGLPTIDTTYTSNPASAYGSPRDEDINRFGFGLSPVNTKGLSVLDAPLPASFDSNGISHAARYGPWPSSVPSKFGLESPSPSLNAAKDGRTSETLKLLHDSAFGGSDHLSPSAISSAEMGGFGSSPPTNSTMHGIALASDEYFGRKAMHSSSLRFSKPRLLSSSAPKIDRDWEAGFLFEEDYVPGTLANEVLTPAEKARRGSTTNTVRAGDLDQPTEPAPIGMTKFGSPATAAASPSRWGSFFHQRQRDEDGLDMGGSSHSLGSNRPVKYASAFGHVGSPLRNSSLANGIIAELNGDSNRPGSSRQGSGSGSESLSVLTQQLQLTRLDDTPSSSPHLHPNMVRPVGGPIGAGIIGKERDKERGLERHVSSGSIGSSVTGRFTTPIDEEDPAFVFSMEEEDDAQVRARKRASGGHLGASSPLSAGWSYAAAVASNRNGAAGGVNGGSARSGGAAVETVGGR
ncbi:hypothetical protein B0T25DRAFT_460843 [Lasiosphaeria hispida]|uniref:C3H1-type domain-containing protein n=1 Tax=Lasiosphaeria hispida TaxID=260671 RepID=A0AAJ0MA24_9PEZI|nr:hypothetical protein B0T25DRAFT_460843 [Lasiosphaeria hispida]